MTDSIHIPSDRNFIANLILQRTGRFLALGGGMALNHWFATGNKTQLVDYLVQHRLTSTYLKDVVKDFQLEADTMCSMLPTEALSKIVSIGPGNGILELMLMKRSGAGSILLIDVEETQNHHHGFQRTGAGYAVLARTKQFLCENGITSDRIITCNPTLEPLPEFSFSLLVSFLSMGFHYPCDQYVEFIKNNAIIGAAVVIDKRKDSVDHGYECMIKTLKVEQSIDSVKSSRILLRNT